MRVRDSELPSEFRWTDAIRRTKFDLICYEAFVFGRIGLYEFVAILMDRIRSA